MPEDAFSNTADNPMAPAANCFPIVPSDTAELTRITKAIYIGTGGDVVLLPHASAASVLFKNVPEGSVLPVRVKAIRATGTTAADIVGLV